MLTGSRSWSVAFEGNKAETKTMLPVIESFMAAHDLPDVTVVADAGMVSEAIRGRSRLPGCRSSSARGSRTCPTWSRSGGASIPARTSLTGTSSPSRGPPGRTAGRRDQVIYYQYRADRARRTLRGIDEQVKKAEQAVAGKTPVKRNRFVQLSGGTRKVNRELEEKARALAGLKGYVTNLRACPDGTPVTAEFVIGAYHQLFQIEKSFRMAKSDLQARPVYHRKRDSIEAHLTIVFAALAVSRWIEHRTGWSIRKFVKTARRYRTIQIQAGRTPSPPPTPCPTTSARPSTRSTAGPMRTKLAQLRSNSSYSSANGQCVEVAKNLSGVMAVRDSKNPDGPRLLISIADGEPSSTA